MSIGLLAQVYSSLAEALAEPTSGWLAAPGCGWPLYTPVSILAAQDDHSIWRTAFLKITAVQGARLETRCSELHSMLSPAALYACHHLDGLFPGPTTFAVQKIYRQAGLDVVGAEMPDHASLELAFLAFLCEQEARCGEDAKDWHTSRKLFIKNHAEKWLPQVADGLLASGFPAWEAVGAALAGSLDMTSRSGKPSKASQVLPKILEEDCTLCGFCVQVCPAHALHIHEDENHTELWLQPEKCIGCRKCEKVCPEGALVLAEMNITKPAILHRSARARCPKCGAPTVSRSELNAVAARLGDHPIWLDICMECR